MPLSAQEKALLLEMFEQLEVDLELLQLAQDEDLRELYPVKFSLARSKKEVLCQSNVNA